MKTPSDFHLPHKDFRPLKIKSCSCCPFSGRDQGKTLCAAGLYFDEDWRFFELDTAPWGKYPSSPPVWCPLQSISIHLSLREAGNENTI